VEDAQLFGIAFICSAGEAGVVVSRLHSNLTANGAKIHSLLVVAPQLEDLFIAMLENEE
jgi:hypothetical protein